MSLDVKIKKDLQALYPSFLCLCPVLHSLLTAFGVEPGGGGGYFQWLLHWLVAILCTGHGHKEHTKSQMNWHLNYAVQEKRKLFVRVCI